MTVEPEKQLLEESLELLRVEISQDQVEQLLGFIELIMRELPRQRLVGSRSRRELIVKHIYDSLYPLSVTGWEAGELLDLGTGAGLPGIPLKICRPEISLYLLDATQKKINFLRRASGELKLERVYFLPGRAEEWGRQEEYRERFSVIVSRAVAGAATLLELALPLARLNGAVLLFKGSQGPAEMESAAEALRLCGGLLMDSWRYRLPTGEERTLFLVKKVEQTSRLYPRRVGIPAKNPL